MSYARHNDPQTSKIAARDAAAGAGSKRDRILKFMRMIDRPTYREEIAQGTDLSLDNVWKRLSELHRMNQIEMTGKEVMGSLNKYVTEFQLAEPTGVKKPVNSKFGGEPRFVLSFIVKANTPININNLSMLTGYNPTRVMDCMRELLSRALITQMTAVIDGVRHSGIASTQMGTDVYKAIKVCPNKTICPHCGKTI